MVRSIVIGALALLAGLTVFAGVVGTPDSFGALQIGASLVGASVISATVWRVLAELFE